MVTTIAPVESTSLFELAEVHFISGLAGLEEYDTWLLEGIDDGPVYWLQCASEPSLALPVVEAFVVEPAYAFDLSDADAGALALERPEDALVLAILSVPRDGGQATANLLAPVVINRTDGTAKQVILDGTSYGLRHPVG